MDPTVPTNPADSETYRDEIGADGCGCPVTAEISMANSSEVEGTQRTEHRPKCWAAEPKGYAVTGLAEKASHAYALHRMGEALRDLPDFTDVWICIQPGLPDVAEGNRATVDAVAQALFGKDGKDETRTGGGYVYGATGTFGPIRVSITAQVPGPPDERDAEIERLRSELAKLHAETDTTGNSFSREPDEVKPTSAVPNGVDGHSEFSGRASVPDMVTRYFSFGHGQTDPDTGESLLDKYATVIAPTVEACRAAMFASRFGNRWSFDYAPDDPKWIEWGPQWTEHERLVVRVGGE